MSLEARENLINQRLSNAANYTASNEQIESLLQGGRLAAAGQVFGLDENETLQLVNALKGRSEGGTEMQGRLERRAADNRDRSDKMEAQRLRQREAGRRRIQGEGATSEQLAELGIDAAKYRTGEQFDDQNRASWDRTKIITPREDDQSSFQNFGGVNKKGETKDGAIAAEERQRALAKRRTQEEAVLPKDRPDLDTYIDNLIDSGEVSATKGESMRYAMKKASPPVTDPVGDRMKTRDFGIPQVRGNQGRERIKNEAGYPGYYKWEESGDLTIPRLVEVRDSGTSEQDDAGREIRELRGQISAEGDLDPITGEVIKRAQHKPGVGLNVDAIMGSKDDTVTVKGGRGRYVETRKKNGQPRYLYKPSGQEAGNFAYYSAGTSGLSDAAKRIEAGLASGTIPTEKVEEATALLARLRFNSSPEIEMRARKEQGRQMVKDDAASRTINQETVNRNLDRAVNASEANQVFNERFNRLGTLTNGLVGVTKNNPERKKLENVSQSVVNAADLPEALRTSTGEYIDEFNDVLGEQRVKAADSFFDAAYGDDFELNAQSGNRAASWIANSVIDERDLNAAGGYRETFPVVGINTTLKEVSDAFRGKGVKMTRDIRTAEDLQKAADVYVRIKARGNNPIWAMQEGKQVAVQNAEIKDVLADMKVSSPLQKRLARALFAVESARTSGVDSVLKQRYVETGEGMQRSDVEMEFGRNVVLDGQKGMESTTDPAQARGKIDNGISINQLIRNIDPEKNLLRRTESAIAQEAEYLGRPLNKTERRIIENQLRDETVIYNPVEDREEGIASYKDDVTRPDIGALRKVSSKTGKEIAAGGNPDLKRRVYQGMTDGQIEYWYAQKGRKGADQAVAKARGLREAAQQQWSPADVESFANRTRTPQVVVQPGMPAAPEAGFSGRGAKMASGYDTNVYTGGSPQSKGERAGSALVGPIRQELVARKQPIRETGGAMTIGLDPEVPTGPQNNVIEEVKVRVEGQQSSGPRYLRGDSPQSQSNGFQDMLQRMLRNRKFQTGAAVGGAALGGIGIGSMINNEREERKQEQYQ